MVGLARGATLCAVCPPPSGPTEHRAQGRWVSTGGQEPTTLARGQSASPSAAAGALPRRLLRSPWW